MDYTGIESVHFGSDDLTQSRRFFTDWGLKKTSHSAKLLRFQTGNGAEVVVRDASSALLAPPLSEGAQFREFVLGVKTQRDLDRLAMVEKYDLHKVCLPQQLAWVNGLMQA